MSDEIQNSIQDQLTTATVNSVSQPTVDPIHELRNEILSLKTALSMMASNAGTELHDRLTAIETWVENFSKTLPTHIAKFETVKPEQSETATK